MSVEKFIADRISNSGNNKGNISKPIVKIGIIGIATGIAVMILTVSIVLGFKREIVSRITGLTTHIAISNINVNPSNEPEPIIISADSLKLLRQLPFVSHIQRIAYKNGLLKTGTENEGVLLKGVDKGYDFKFIQDHLVEGQLPDLGTEMPSKDILVSESLCKKLGLKLHDKVLIHFISQHPVFDSTLMADITKSEHFSRKLVICGIFKTNFADFDDKLSLIDIRQVQKINFWSPEMVGNYEFKLKDLNKLEANTEELRNLFGYNYSVNNVRDIYYNIFVWLEKLDVNAIIVVVLMVIVATINMIAALLILILERTTMVGLLKTLGMTNTNVRKLFLHISYKLIGSGLVWGNLIGITLCLLQQHFKIAALDSETYYVDYVAIEINWLYFLFLNIGTFTVCSLMLFLPTLILTKLTPVKTLKFD